MNLCNNTMQLQYNGQSITIQWTVFLTSIDVGGATTMCTPYSQTSFLCDSAFHFFCDNRRHWPTSCLTSPTFAADGPHHQVWWRNSSGRTSWPGPPLLYNTDLFVFSAQQMRHQALFAPGIWGLAVGTKASHSWQELPETLWSFSMCLNTPHVLNITCMQSLREEDAIA